MGNTKIELEIKTLRIVDYLGIEAGSAGKYCIPQFVKKDMQGNWKDDYTLAEMEFHYSWSWIMPVMTKILADHKTTCHLQSPGYSDLGARSKQYMFAIGEDTIFSSYVYHESPVRAIFEALVMFIVKKKNFYNEAKESPN